MEMDWSQMGSHFERIEKANAEIRKAKAIAASDPYRLAYHIMAPAGWMNDPNGLIQFRGEYHVFYQHHPYSSKWGPMHWGHVKSRDLVQWEHLPIALAPGEAYDMGGCFSGSAVENDNMLTLIYTGNGQGEKTHQVQCTAVSCDGVHFTKYEGNPVIPQPPSEGSSDFRDPKVWQYGDMWYMVVGSGKDGVGKALLYTSSDLLHWNYIGTAAESNGSQGTMWECPDLFPLEDKHVLITSPIGMKDGKNIYIVGEMDYKTGTLTQQFYDELDRGADFYAAQTLQDQQGRRILIAWMDMWGSPMPTQEGGWAGALTLPRVLSFYPDGRLRMQPVPELTGLRGEHFHWEGLQLAADGSSVVRGLQGDCLEIRAVFQADPSSHMEFGIGLRCSNDDAEGTWVRFYPKERLLAVDCSRSGIASSPEDITQCPLSPDTDGLLMLHIFLDRSSIEVFANDGRAVLSNRIYPAPENQEVRLWSKDGSVRLISLDAWQMKDIWQDAKTAAQL